MQSSSADEVRYSRGTLIAAARVVGDLGHTELDDLLLEWGAPGLEAGRDLGSRAQRAVAISAFVIANPEALTADNGSVASALIMRAQEECGRHQYDDYGEAGAHRAAFKAALARDGSVERGAATASPIVQPADRSWSAMTAATSSHNEQSLHNPSGAPRVLQGKRVFLVHGRDNAAKDRVTLFLERLGLEVIILHEQPNSGRTLLAKFKEEASSAQFAVVLMTGDDLGCLASDESPRRRARQNVVFELGFFIGSLPPKHVCALVEAGIERPSDFDAIAYVEFDPADNWKRELARELRAAGLPINTDALLR